jgi:hypothetical protein
VSKTQAWDQSTNAGIGALPASAAESKIHSEVLVARLLLAAAFLLLVALAYKGWRDIDGAWDSTWYHMPFAALRVGLISQKQYQISQWLSTYYDGFPELPDYLQGIAWRLTSRPQAANLVSLFALVCVTIFFRIRYKVPFGYIFVGLLGIPMVLIQSTSTYVDLFTNSFATIGIFTLFWMWMEPERFTTGDLLVVFASVAVAINSKPQFVAIGTLALAALLIGILLNRQKLTCLRDQLRRATTGRRLLVVAACILCLCLAYVNPAKNLIKFHNPAYPAKANIGHWHLPGSYKVRSIANYPPYLEQFPQYRRWIISIIEYDSFDGRNPLWTNSDGDVGPRSAAHMGGAFGALVLFNLFFFLILQGKVRRRYGRKPAAFLVIITVVTAVMPASQEIRYYMYWIMCLVALNLVLIEKGMTEPERGTFRLVSAAAMSSFLIFVLCATGMQYVSSNGVSMESLVKEGQIERQLVQMNLLDGEVVCVKGKIPRTFFYAPIFNPKMEDKYHYGIIEFEDDKGCMGKRVLQ